MIVYMVVHLTALSCQEKTVTGLVHLRWDSSCMQCMARSCNCVSVYVLPPVFSRLWRQQTNDCFVWTSCHAPSFKLRTSIPIYRTRSQLRSAYISPSFLLTIDFSPEDSHGTLWAVTVYLSYFVFVFSFFHPLCLFLSDCGRLSCR